MYPRVSFKGMYHIIEILLYFLSNNMHTERKPTLFFKFVQYHRSLQKPLNPIDTDYPMHLRESVIISLNLRRLPHPVRHPIHVVKRGKVTHFIPFYLVAIPRIRRKEYKLASISNLHFFCDSKTEGRFFCPLYAQKRRVLMQITVDFLHKKS